MLLAGVILAGLVALRLADPLLLAAVREGFSGLAAAWLPGPLPVAPPFALAAEIAAALIAGLALALLIPRLRPGTGLIAGLVAILLVAAAWFAARRFGLAFDPTWPIVSIAILCVVLVAVARHRAEAGRAEVRQVFGRSLSLVVIDRIAAGTEPVERRGETRELTVLSCRLRDFAMIAASRNPRELTALLRDLMSPLADLILAEDGTIAEFAADRIQAFWNAPLAEPRHAERAAAAALAMARHVEALNLGWLAQSEKAGTAFTRIAIGIGVETGAAVVGDVGARRTAYVAAGEVVTVAPAIAELSRRYGVAVVLGEETVSAMATPRVLELDLVRFRDREKPLRLFTLLDSLGGDHPALARLAPIHARLISAYRGGDWNAAEAALRECRGLRIEPLVTLYSLYRTRIAMTREIVQPVDWDGTDLLSEDERRVTEVTPGPARSRHTPRAAPGGKQGD